MHCVPCFGTNTKEPCCIDLDVQCFLLRAYGNVLPYPGFQCSGSGHLKKVSFCVNHVVVDFINSISLHASLLLIMQIAGVLINNTPPLSEHWVYRIIQCSLDVTVNFRSLQCIFAVFT